MRPPRFWSEAPSRPLARLLAPLGQAYGAVSAGRMDRAGERAGCPVICIGNVTLGGAGKTPTALAIAQMLAAGGRAPAFLSRGYGGRLPGPIRVEPQDHTARDVGDEPLLLARQAMTIVSRDRPAGARLCVEQSADIVVMDDGLQNPSLIKDLSLAVIDAGAGIGNGLVFPAGPLRAPLGRQWGHIDGLVVIGDGAGGDAVAVEAHRRGLPVHPARLVAQADVSGQRVLAFAGIGRPQKFFESLAEAGAEVAGTRAFPDHHAFRSAELEALSAKARRLDAVLMTTDKDWVRLPPDFAADVRTLPVRLRFADAARIGAQLETLVATIR